MPIPAPCSKANIFREQRTLANIVRRCSANEHEHIPFRGCSSFATVLTNKFRLSCRSMKLKKAWPSERLKSRGRPSTSCARSCRQRAYELRKWSRPHPVELLIRDIDTARIRDCIRQQVREVLLETGNTHLLHHPNRGDAVRICASSNSELRLGLRNIQRKKGDSTASEQLMRGFVDQTLTDITVLDHPSFYRHRFGG
jgi:hypothetical protein